MHAFYTKQAMDYIHFCELNNIFITLQFKSHSANHDIRPLTDLGWWLYSNNSAPISFIWNNPEQTPITPELIEWVKDKFIPIFNSDEFLWKASTHTAPKELQCHLLGQTNNS